jgi:hypothetical protein
MIIHHGRENNFETYTVRTCKPAMSNIHIAAIPGTVHALETIVQSFECWEKHYVELKLAVSQLIRFNF